MMNNIRRKTIILIFFIWFLGRDRVFAEKDTAHIWWLAGAGRSLSDGRFEQALTLNTSSVIAAEQPPEVWLRITAGRARVTSWRKGEWLSSDPWVLIVQSNEYAAVNVFARAEIDGLPYSAETRLILYGQSNETDEREWFSEGPDWPEFEVRSSGEFYWPQTGHEFSLSFSGEGNGGPLELRGGQGELLDEIQGSGNVYKYTPPHDPALNRAGTSAAKPLVFVIRTDEGGSASFTQLVHRSRFAGLNKRAGLIVFASAFLLSGLIAVRANRVQLWR